MGLLNAYKDINIILYVQFRLAYRDIGGSDPERMAPPRVAEYVEALFKDTDIKVRGIYTVLETAYVPQLCGPSCLATTRNLMFTVIIILSR